MIWGNVRFQATCSMDSLGRFKFLGTTRKLNAVWTRKSYQLLGKLSLAKSESSFSCSYGPIYNWEYIAIFRLDEEHGRHSQEDSYYSRSAFRAQWTIVYFE